MPETAITPHQSIDELLAVYIAICMKAANVPTTSIDGPAVRRESGRLASAVITALDRDGFAIVRKADTNA